MIGMLSKAERGNNMAWDPNVPGNPAWMSVEASKHGGPLQYIADIENLAREEGKEAENHKWKLIVSVAIPLATAVGAGAKWCWDKVKEKRIKRELLKEKSMYAKEVILGHNDEKMQMASDNPEKTLDEKLIIPRSESYQSATKKKVIRIKKRTTPKREMPQSP